MQHEKTILLLLLVYCVPLFSAVHIDKTQADLYEELVDITHAKGSRKHALEFGFLLAQNTNIKLRSEYIGNIIEHIMVYQVNKHGGAMLMSLHQFQDVDFNNLTIAERQVSPLAFAVAQASYNIKGIALVRALIDAGASPDVEQKHDELSLSLRSICKSKAREDLRAQYKETSLVPYTEEIEQHDRKEIETFLHLLPKHPDKYLHSGLPNAVYILRALSVPVHSNEGLRRSSIKSIYNIQKMLDKGEHVCTCEYCGLPFT